MNDQSASIGLRIRQRRRTSKIKQADLAQQVGISASYLNLIEHDRRRIGGALLIKLAAALEVDPLLLSEGVHASIVNSLRELSYDILGSEISSEIEEFATRYPIWANVAVSQQQKIGILEGTISALNERLSQDPRLSSSIHNVLSIVTAIQSLSSILNETDDIEPEWQKRFLRNIGEESQRLTKTSETLIEYLEAKPETSGQLSSPYEEMDSYFAKHSYDFPTLEGLAPNERDNAISDQISGESLSQSAKWLIENALHQYAEDALALPRMDMKDLVQDLGADPLGIAKATGHDIPKVMRRLSHLPTSITQSPIGLIICDAAGSVLFQKPVEGFRVPRYSAACSLWPLFLALQTPMRCLSHVIAQTSSGAQNIETLSYAALASYHGDQGELVAQSYMFMKPIDAEAQDGKVLHVGATCALCTAEQCQSRREPSLLNNNNP